MVAVIGDIHGCYFTLVELYHRIKKIYTDIPLYCVGDLVDRGNHSHSVMEFIIDEKIRFTPGNHDFMFSHYFKNPGSIFARSWNLNGNEMTLQSYEGWEKDIYRHIDQIHAAPLYYNTPDCFISHAGISEQYRHILDPGYKDDITEIEELIYNDYATDRGVLWTRDNLLNLGKLQVIGHTKQTEISFDEESNALYIDTGACIGNKLSAVIIHESEVVDTFEENTHLNDII